ncbi:MAG: hypothetical protein HW391_1026 [Chloroflexi bacterium]|nr:hypothetical protein [Chloroflexota bacterium]
MSAEGEVRSPWIVEQPRLTGKIQLAAYDPEWPALFEREAIIAKAGGRS